jgi:acetyl-CoA carboxylase carboxyltransferase component
VVGRAHGQALVAMGATRSMSSVCLAWPTADPPGGTLYEAAKRGTIDRVIEPYETRAALIEALAMLARHDRPHLPRKHENLPL